MRYFGLFGTPNKSIPLYCIAGSDDMAHASPRRFEELPIVPYRTTRVWVHPHETREFLRHVLLEQADDQTAPISPVGDCVYEGNPHEAYALFLTYVQLLKGAPA